MGEETVQHACSRFGALDLHDSRLLGLQLVRRDGELVDDLHVDIELLLGQYPESTWRPARLSFLDCTRIVIEVDLSAKQVCGDAMASSWCERDDVLRTDLKQQGLEAAETRLEPYAEFVIDLCPPSGTLRITARDCRLERAPVTPAP